MASKYRSSKPYPRSINLIHNRPTTCIEVPLSAARIMLHQKADMVPLAKPVAEVCAVAKRDMAAGESLDSIGETCYRSYAMTRVDAQTKSAVPVGLLEGGKTTASIKKGDLLAAANVTPDTTTKLYACRQEKDAMLSV